jgi:CAAX prenyl protease-like protein
VVRVLGSALVVPPLEEVFYRSFIYRYLAKADFQSVPLGAFAWVPFLVDLGGVRFRARRMARRHPVRPGLPGLVCWKRRLGDAMTAHAITNFLLGGWVVWKGAWRCGEQNRHGVRRSLRLGPIKAQTKTSTPAWVG